MAKVQKFKVNIKNAPLRVVFQTLVSAFGIVVIQTRSLMFDMLPNTESKHCSPIEIIYWRRLIIENLTIQLNCCLFAEAIQSRHSLLACTCGENSSVSCSRNIIIVQGKLLSCRKQARHFAQKTFYI